MKPTIIILHGVQGHAGIHWQKWLHDEMVKQQYKVIMPDLPNTVHPDRKEWKKFVLETVLSEKTVFFVAHSLSVVTVLDAVEELEKPFIGLASVSGFCSDYGADLNSYFLKEKTIDFSKIKQHLTTSAIFYGDDDPYVPQEYLKELADKLGVVPIIIPKGGHLNTTSGFTQFPLLLQQVQALL